MTIGTRIRAAREAANLSREELAQRVGYNHANSIMHIELGSRGVPIQKFEPLMRALNIPEGEWPELIALASDGDPSDTEAA